MLIGAFICLIITVSAAIISYKSKQPTLLVAAKLLFHLFLILFIICLFIYLFEFLPPPSKESSLPL